MGERERRRRSETHSSVTGDQLAPGIAALTTAATPSRRQDDADV